MKMGESIKTNLKQTFFKEMAIPMWDEVMGRTVLNIQLEFNVSLTAIDNIIPRITLI